MLLWNSLYIAVCKLKYSPWWMTDLSSSTSYLTILRIQGTFFAMLFCKLYGASLNNRSTHSFSFISFFMLLEFLSNFWGNNVLFPPLDNLQAFCLEWKKNSPIWYPAVNRMFVRSAPLGTKVLLSSKKSLRIVLIFKIHSRTEPLNCIVKILRLVIGVRALHSRHRSWTF